MADQGKANELPPPSHHAERTEVWNDTPMGEWLRRYWQPIGLAAIQRCWVRS